jgi:hypothetical protein
VSEYSVSYPRFDQEGTSLKRNKSVTHSTATSMSYQLSLSICRTISNKWEQLEETKTSERRWSATKIVVEGKIVKSPGGIRQIPDILCVLYYMWSWLKSCNNVPTATLCSIDTTDKWSYMQRSGSGPRVHVHSEVVWHQGKEKRFVRLGAYVVSTGRNNQPDALIIQIHSVIKLYMFRASSLPIIRSSLLCIRYW